jgi:hypothetical protein
MLQLVTVVFSQIPHRAESQEVDEPVAVASFLGDCLDEIFDGVHQKTYRVLTDHSAPTRRLSGDSNVFVLNQLTSGKAYGQADLEIRQRAALSLLKWLGGTQKFSVRAEDEWQFPDDEIYKGPWGVHSTDNRDSGISALRPLQRKRILKANGAISCQCDGFSRSLPNRRGVLQLPMPHEVA